MRPKIISVTNFCWAEREEQKNEQCRSEHYSKQAGWGWFFSPGEIQRLLVLQGNHRIPHQPLQNPFLPSTWLNSDFTSWKLPDRASKTTSHPSRLTLHPKCCSDNLRVWNIAPTSAPTSRAHRNIASKCRKPRCTADPAGCSHPRNCEYCTGESCWDEQAAGARCINNQPTAAETPYKSLQLFPFPWINLSCRKVWNRRQLNALTPIKGEQFKSLCYMSTKQNKIGKAKKEVGTDVSVWWAGDASMGRGKRACNNEGKMDRNGWGGLCWGTQGRDQRQQRLKQKKGSKRILIA